jgi:hypothetical protein
VCPANLMRRPKQGGEHLLTEFTHEQSATLMTTSSGITRRLEHQATHLDCLTRPGESGASIKLRAFQMQHRSSYRIVRKTPIHLVR